MALGIIYILGIAFASILLTAVTAFFFFVIRSSDRILLRWYNARESEDPKLSRTLKALAEQSGIPCPKLYTIESPMPNAFSCGKSPGNASVVITTEAVKQLDRGELESVFAHEIFHIKNEETRNATITAALGGILTASATVALWGSMFLGFGQERDPAPRLIRFFAMSLSAPHAAFMIHLTKPGTREYAADEYSAKLCKNPETLASALKKMDGMKLQMNPNPSHAHIFIINPLNDDNNNNEVLDEIFNSLFDTHPPVDLRIKRLNELAT